MPDNINPKYLKKLAEIESSNNPNAKAETSSAAGLYQFTKGTWNELVKELELDFTEDDRYDPEKSKVVVQKFTEDNKKYLESRLKREINDGELYLAHFLGRKGALDLLTSIDSKENLSVLETVNPKAIEANKGVFYNKDGSLKNSYDIYNWATKKMDVPKRKSISPDIIENNLILDNITKNNLLDENQQSGLVIDEANALLNTTPSFSLNLGLNTNIPDYNIKPPETVEDNSEVNIDEERKNLLGYTGDIGAFPSDFKLLDKEFLRGGFTNSNTNSNLINEFNSGGSHEESPLGGIPLGINQQGGLNLVEEGETSYNDYIFSDTLKVDKTYIEENNLPDKYEGLTFAEASKDIQSQIDERPFDKLTKKTAENTLNQLIIANEKCRLKKGNSKDNKYVEGGLIDPPEKNNISSDETIKSSKDFVTDWFNHPISRIKLQSNIMDLGPETASKYNAGDVINKSIENINKVPHSIYEANPKSSTKGLYNPAENKMSFFGEPTEEISAHEVLHSGNQGLDKIGSDFIKKNYGSPHQAIQAKTGTKNTTDALVKQFEFDTTSVFDREKINKQKENINYLSNPKELYPKIMEMRRFLNVVPGQEIEDNQIQQLQESDNEGVRRLFDIYEPEQIKSMLNTLASQDNNDLNTYAKHGGIMKKKNKKYGPGGSPENVDPTKSTPGIGSYLGAATTAMDFGNQLFGDSGIDSSGTQRYEKVSQGGEALGGAMKGAQAGMAFGPWGAAIGGVVGGVTGLISGGKKAKEVEEANHNFVLSTNSKLRESDFENGGTKKSLGDYSVDEVYNDIQLFLNKPDFTPINDISADTAGTYSSNINTNQNNDKSKFNLNDALRYTPVAGNFLRYLNAPEAETESLDRLDHRYQPSYVDEASLLNNIKQSTSNTRRSLLDASEGSGSAARSGLLASQINEARAISEAMFTGDRMNASEDRIAQQFNLGVDSTNLNQSNQEKQINAQNRAAAQTNKDVLLNAVLGDIGNIGRENILNDILKRTTGYSKTGEYKAKSGGYLSNMLSSIEDTESTDLKKYIKNSYGY